MKRIFGVLLMVSGSLLLLLWIALLAMAMSEGESINFNAFGKLIPVIALVLLILGIFMVFDGLLDVLYNFLGLLGDKSLQREKRKAFKKSKNYEMQNSLKNEETHANLNQTDKNTFYQVEKIYTAKKNKTFSGFFRMVMPFLYPIGIVILVVMLVPKHDDFMLVLACVIFFSCCIIGWGGYVVALRVNAKGKDYGIVLAQKWDKNENVLIGKELFFVKNASTLTSKVKGISLETLFKNRKERISDILGEEEVEKILDGFLETLQSEEFKICVEEEINNPKDAIEGWIVNPMNRVKLGRTGFFGTKVIFYERDGMKNSCLLSRDFAEYKEIKKLIKGINGLK